MTVTAPPRPPRPSDPMDREEVEALVEALIEEARQRARRRRRIYLAVAAASAFVAVVVVTVFDFAAQSGTASPASAAPSSAAAAPTSSRIAFVAGVLKPSRSGGFLQTELYVMNADGSGMRRLVRHASGLVEPYSGPGRLTGASSPSGSGSARPSGSVGSATPRSSSRTPTAAASETSPATSAATALPGRPTGRRSRSRVLATPLPPDLYIMNADGSGQRPVTQDPLPAGRCLVARRAAARLRERCPPGVPELPRYLRRERRRERPAATDPASATGQIPRGHRTGGGSPS